MKRNCSEFIMIVLTLTIISGVITGCDSNKDTVDSEKY